MAWILGVIEPRYPASETGSVLWTCVDSVIGCSHFIHLLIFILLMMIKRECACGMHRSTRRRGSFKVEVAFSELSFRMIADHLGLLEIPILGFKALINEDLIAI